MVELNLVWKMVLFVIREVELVVMVVVELVCVRMLEKMLFKVEVRLFRLVVV